MAFKPGYEASNQEQWVRRALEKSYRYDMIANDSIVLNAASSNPDATAGDIAAIVEHLGSRGALIINPEWSQPFDEFFERNPRFAKSQANLGILENAWTQSGRMLSAAEIELVAYDPSVVGQLAEAPQYVDAQRAQQVAAARAERERVEAEQIRAEMLGWLTNGPRQAQLKSAGAYPTIFPMEVKKETARLAAMNHAQLVEEVLRRREVRRIKGLGAKEYRAEVAISCAAGEQPVVQQKMTRALSSQYEVLPATHTTRSGLVVNMDRAGLIKVCNTDSFAFRELVRRYGSEAINDILAGRV